MQKNKLCLNIAFPIQPLPTTLLALFPEFIIVVLISLFRDLIFTELIIGFGNFDFWSMKLCLGLKTLYLAEGASVTSHFRFENVLIVLLKNRGQLIFVLCADNLLLEFCLKQYIVTSSAQNGNITYRKQ